MLNHHRRGLSVVLLALIAMIMTACSSLPWAATAEPTPIPTVIPEGVLSAEGRLVPLHSVMLAFQSGGELGDLPVKEGDSVMPGDVLARLGKREAQEAALSQANLEVLSAQQALDVLNDAEALDRQQANQALADARSALNQARIALDDVDTQEFRDELDDRNLAVQDAKQELDDARTDLAKYQDLDPENSTRKNAQEDYDDAFKAYNRAIYDRNEWQYQRTLAQAAVDLAAARVDDAQRLFDNRRSGVDADMLALAQSRLEAASAQAAAARRALEDTELMAPFAGMVVDLQDLEPGEMLAPGQAVVTLADTSVWLVETRDLTELDVVEVQPGQQVTITPDAIPDLTLDGTVESIARVFSERSGDILYTVRIRLNGTDERLRWGMTVNVVFER